MNIILSDSISGCIIYNSGRYSEGQILQPHIQPDCKNIHRLSGRLAPLGIMGAQLKPSILYGRVFEGVSGGP